MVFHVPKSLVPSKLRGRLLMRKVASAGMGVSWSWPVWPATNGSILTIKPCKGISVVENVSKMGDDGEPKLSPLKVIGSLL